MSQVESGLTISHPLPQKTFLSSIESMWVKFVSQNYELISAVGRQNSDTQTISEAMNNGFSTVVKAIVYTVLVMLYLLYLSPQLLGVLLAGVTLLALAGGSLGRISRKLNT
jgi:ABC-type multidrug transport system fused ATPase/permease subunit